MRTNLLKILYQLGVAIDFLTVVPVRPLVISELREVGESAWAFPLVGALIGLILAAFHWLCYLFFPPSVTSILVVTLWIILTGGLHLDGWADCMDALPAAVAPERRRRILKDPRLGSFGALGLVIVLLLKIATISVATPPNLVLLLAPMLGRWMIIVTAFNAQVGDHGMAAGFGASITKGSVFWASVTLSPILIFFGFKALIYIMTTYLVCRLFKGIAEKRLGRINGDVLGAVCELAEVATLVVYVAKIH